MEFVHVEVVRINGQSAQIRVSEDSTVEELRREAQVALRMGRGVLLNASGDLLQATATLGQANVKTGDVLTLHSHGISVAAAESAFVAILSDTSVVAWGSSLNGGNTVSRLRNAQLIQSSTNGAFAAILRDGSVVTWGNPACGGDSSSVQHQLRDVRQPGKPLGWFLFFCFFVLLFFFVLFFLIGFERKIGGCSPLC